MIKFNKNINSIKINNINIISAKINGNVIFGENIIGGTPLYKFGLLSDVHIDGDGTDTYNTNVKFTNALNFFKNNNCNFICIAGDVSYDGRLEDFEKYQELSQGMTIKTISGNHDAKNIEYYKQYMNNDIYYEYLINDDVFLFLGADGNYSYDKPLSDEEMLWFKEKLELYKDKRVFVIFHFFISPVGNVNNLAKTDYFNIESEQGQEFLNIMQNYKNIILCTGHSHLEFSMEKYGQSANFLNDGNTCARVHTPSLGYPKTNDTGVSGNDTYNLKDVGFGYLVEVYNNKIIFKALKVGLTSSIILNNYIYIV